VGIQTAAVPRPEGGAVIARLVGIVGGILTPIFLLLAQVSADGEKTKGWESYKAVDIVVALFCVVAVVVLALTLRSGKVGPLALAGSLLFASFCFVLALPLEAVAQSDGELSLGIGAWLALLASLAASVGALAAAALAGAINPVDVAEARALGGDGGGGGGRGASALNRQPALPTGAPQQAPQSGPAPGWYEDPNRQARLRYFDGVNWTDQTSN
jgi:hypothetical protein